MPCKKNILLLLLSALLIIILCGYAKRPKESGSVFGVIEKDGKTMDNVLVVFDKEIQTKLDWTKSKFYLTDVPAKTYKTIKIYAKDSIKGSYYLELTNFSVLANKTVHFPKINLSKENEDKSLEFPNYYRFEKKEIEFSQFPANSTDITDVKIKKPILGMFGGNDWQTEIDEIVNLLLEFYVTNRFPTHFVVVTGYASPVEMEDKPKELLKLSVERAKSVVEYINENYRLGTEHFIVFGEGTNNIKKKRDLHDGDNMRVLMHYDSRY